jgi:hypothetical protein
VTVRLIGTFPIERKKLMRNSGKAFWFCLCHRQVLRDTVFIIRFTSSEP